MSEQKDANRKNYVRAAYAPDGPGGDSMISLLKDHGIDAFRQGGTKDIYKIGGDVFGEEIMVPPDDLERAQALLQQTGPSRMPAGSSRGNGVKMTLLCLLAAAALLALALLLRGRFLT